MACCGWLHQVSAVEGPPVDQLVSKQCDCSLYGVSALRDMRGGVEGLPSLESKGFASSKLPSVVYSVRAWQQLQ